MDSQSLQDLATVACLIKEANEVNCIKQSSGNRPLTQDSRFDIKSRFYHTFADLNNIVVEYHKCMECYKNEELGKKPQSKVMPICKAREDKGDRNHVSHTPHSEFYRITMIFFLLLYLYTSEVE